jgi:hypothetical protein
MASLAGLRASPAFDPQVYRILVRYLANHSKLEWRDLEVASHLGSAGVY